MTLHILLPAGAALALVCLPYLYAALAAGPDYMFSGFLFNPQDGNSYLAKMYQGWQGSWRFTLPYTAEPGEGVYLFIFYLFLGHVARWLGLGLPLVFHLARVLGAVALYFALFRFLRRLLPAPQPLGLAFFLCALGSGMGWLAVLWAGFTSDFWVVEGYPFLSTFATPHFAWGLALLLWILTPPGPQAQDDLAETARSGVPVPGSRHLAALALAGLLLSILSPFGVAIALGVLGGLFVWKFLGREPGAWNDAWRLIAVLLGGLPFSVYNYWVSQAHPVLAEWHAQNLTPSPPVWDVALSLAPVILLAGAAVPKLLKKQAGETRMLLVWGALGLALMYFPWSLQRRFMMGLYVPIAALGAMGLHELARGARRRPLAVMAVVLALPTNLVVLLAALSGIQAHDPHIYLSAGEARAVTWLDDHTPPRSLVLASPEMGVFIPAMTGRRVLYGHPFETVQAEAEKAQVEAFFAAGGAANPDAGETNGSEILWTALGQEDPAAWLERRGVEYIFFGPRERSLGDLPPGLRLDPVYSAEGVTLYRVVHPK